MGWEVWHDGPERSWHSLRPHFHVSRSAIPRGHSMRLVNNACLTEYRSPCYQTRLVPEESPEKVVQ